MNIKLQHVVLGVIALVAIAAILKWTGSDKPSFLARDSKYLGSEAFTDGSRSVEETSPAARYPENRKKIRDARALVRNEDFVKAELLYRDILSKTPNEAIAAHELGTALFFQLKYDESGKVYDDLLNKEPDFFQAHNGAGAVARAQGRYLKAIEHYSSAIHSSPNSALAHYGRGVSYFSIGKLDEAKNDLIKTRALLPSSSGLSIQASKLIAEIESSEGAQQSKAPR